MLSLVKQGVSKMSNIFNSTGVLLLAPTIIHSDGCYIISEDNQRYVDFESGVWSLPLGHNHPRINQAIKQQMASISHVGYTYSHAIVEQAAKKLSSISGIPNSKCVFLSSGSEAVEYSLKVTSVLYPNKKWLRLTNQYLSAYGHGSLDQEHWIALPWCKEDDYSYDEWLSILASTINFDEIGAFVFEPGNSSGLVKIPPSNLVHAICTLVKKVNGAIIVDEVTCGIGRTGKWFGYMHYNFTPDIIAVGKGLGNGYPVSAVILHDDVTSKLADKNFYHAQSHQNDPLGCRIALEVLTVIEEKQLLEQANLLGRYFRDSCFPLLTSPSPVIEIRGIGLLNCIQFSKAVSEEKMRKLKIELFHHGFIVGCHVNTRCLRVYMPLITPKVIIDNFYHTLTACLQLIIPDI